MNLVHHKCPNNKRLLVFFLLFGNYIEMLMAKEKEITSRRRRMKRLGASECEYHYIDGETILCVSVMRCLYTENMPWNFRQEKITCIASIERLILEFFPIGFLPPTKSKCETEYKHTETWRERHTDGKKTNIISERIHRWIGRWRVKRETAFGIGTAFGLRNADDKKSQHIPADSLSVTVIYIFQQCNLCVEFLNWYYLF